MRTPALLAVLVLAPLTDASAQEPPPLEPGQQVRVTAPTLDLNRHKTIFQQLRGDTLVLTTLQCPLAQVTRLDVYRGRKSWGWWKGGLIGLLGGAGMGAGIGAAVERAETEMKGTGAAIGALVGAGAGLLIGTAAGIAIRTDRWEEVPPDQVYRLRVSIVPQRGGKLALGVAVRF